MKATQSSSFFTNPKNSGAPLTGLFSPVNKQMDYLKPPMSPKPLSKSPIRVQLLPQIKHNSFNFSKKAI